MPPGRGKTVIKIHVDGGDVVVNAAFKKVRAAVKSTDDVRIERRHILITLEGRDGDAASRISYRLRERLEDFDIEMEIED